MDKIVLLKLASVLGGTIFLFSCTQNSPINKSKDTSEYIDSLLNVADNYRLINVDTMMELSKTATELARKKNYKDGYFQGVLQQGIACFYKGEDSIALLKVRLIEKETWSKEKSSKLLIAKKNSLKGSIYHNRDLYDSAAIYMFDALKTFEQYEQSTQIAMVSANLATNYILTENYDKALEFTQKAELNFQKSGKQEGLVAVYERTGSIYAHQEEYDSALVYFEKSLYLAKDINHSFFIANGYHNVGSVYLEQQNFNRGIEYLQKAKTLYQELNNLLGYSLTLNNLAQIDFEQKQYDLALVAYQEVNEIAIKAQFLSLQEQSHEQISKIYEQQGNFKLALKHHQDAQIINDSIYKKERFETIVKLENQYLNAEKDKLILQQTIDIKTVRNRNLLILLLLIVAIAFFVFFSLKKKTENRLLHEKNKLIEHQRKELKHRTENQLEQLSDLFTIYGLMESEKNEVFRDAKSRIEAINLVYKFLEDSQNDTIEIKPFLENLIDNIIIIFGLQKDELEIEMEILEIEMDANKAQIIGQIVNEILNNAFKHAFENTVKDENKQQRIFIKLNKKNSAFQLIVGDNGRGFDETKLQIKDKMGISLIAAFVKSIRGELTTETNQYGTKYQIIFS